MHDESLVMMYTNQQKIAALITALGLISDYAYSRDSQQLSNYVPLLITPLINRP